MSIEEKNILDEPMISPLKEKDISTKMKGILFCCCILVFIFNFWNKHKGNGL
jgi:hypothetical protein